MNPSGIDVAVSINGGIIKFIKGKDGKENLIEKTNVDMTKYQVILVNTKKTRNSKELI